MTEEFKIAIEELYKVFERYPFKSTIEGCPCCVFDNDKSTLHSKQLRELEDEDISRYVFKAMTTWGDVNDFKHYLPRIFELAATRKLNVDTFVILGKLDYGNWKEWDFDEQNSIQKFLKAWWKLDVNNATYFDSEVLIELKKRIQDLPTMLNDWNVSVDSQGFKNYVDFVESYYPELKGKNISFKDFSQYEIEKLISWIESNSGKLEEGFFNYDGKDEEFSTTISNTLYMIERVCK
jgi:hypothetical protein